MALPGRANGPTDRLAGRTVRPAGQLLVSGAGDRWASRMSENLIRTGAGRLHGLNSESSVCLLVSVFVSVSGVCVGVSASVLGRRAGHRLGYRAATSLV